MNTVSGRENEVLPSLKSQLRHLMIHGAKNRRDRLLAFLHGGLAIAFLMLGIGVATAIHDDEPRRRFVLLLTLPFLINVAIQAARCRAYLRRSKRLRRIVDRGFPVTAHVVQASPGLFRPGSEMLPCLVLFTHQPEVAADLSYMSDLARRVYSLKGVESDHADEKYVASLTRDEKAVVDRRRKLPISFTDGSTVYCADLMINPALLPGRCLTGSTLPCFAEGGDSGGIELVPAPMARHFAFESVSSATRSR